MVEFHALEVEGDQRVDPRWLNAAPSTVGFLSLGDPVDELALRSRATRLHGQPVVELERVIQPHERTGTRDDMHPLCAPGSDQLINADAEVAHRPARDHDEQRRDGPARPACEVVEVERRPRRETHQLRRHARHALPWVHAEQRKPDLGEDACLGEAALIDDESQRALHVRRTRVDSEDAQRDIRLDGGTQVAGSVVVQRPRTVVTLRARDVVDRAVANVVVRSAEKAQQQDVFRGHRDVGLELATPPSGRVLMRQQPVDRCAQRLRLHEPPPATARRAIRQRCATACSRRFAR